MSKQPGWAVRAQRSREDRAVNYALRRAQIGWKISSELPSTAWDITFNGSSYKLRLIEGVWLLAEGDDPLPFAVKGTEQYCKVVERAMTFIWKRENEQ